MILTAQGIYPFTGFGFALYMALALLFWFFHCYFDRRGEPERQRQLTYLQQMPRPELDRSAKQNAAGQPAKRPESK